MTKTHKTKAQVHQHPTIVKGNLVIPVIPGFEIIPGSELEGSPLMLRDPHTQSIYVWIDKIKAREIVNKELARLEKMCNSTDPQLLMAESEARKLKDELSKPEVRAVYHRVGKDVGLHSTTFRFAY